MKQVKVFQNFKEIITLENTINLAVISYTTDFELGICNFLYLACFYYYSTKIRENIKKIINNFNMGKEYLDYNKDLETNNIEDIGINSPNENDEQ